jgi:hypothetical protein
MHPAVALVTQATSGLLRIQKARVLKTLEVQGITLRIDRPAGFVQKGRDESGKEWERTYKTDYGFIPKTDGGDGEPIDVYVGPNPDATLSYWIDQRKADGSFDEWKIMLGFDSRADARAMWAAHTPRQYFGGMETVDVGMMKALLGLDPQPIFKSAAAREQTFATILKLAERDDEPLVAKAHRWSAERGLFESSRGAGVGAAVLGAAEAIVAKSEDGGGRVGRALFLFLCDAYDVARLGADDAEVARVTRPILKAFGAIAGSAAQPIGADHRVTKNVSHETISSAIWAALRERYPQQEDHCSGPWVREVYDDTFVYEHEAKLYRSAYTFDGATAILVGEPEQVVTSYVPVAKSEVPRRHVRLVKAEAAPAAEERTVMGIVLEPDITDSQGHTYDVATVRKAAHDYLVHFRNSGIQHERLANGRIEVLESYLAPAPMNINGVEVKPGTWIMVMRIADEALWAEVKAGKFTGFSIGGVGREEENRAAA